MDKKTMLTSINGQVNRFLTLIQVSTVANIAISLKKDNDKDLVDLIPEAHRIFMEIWKYESLDRDDEKEDNI